MVKTIEAQNGEDHASTWAPIFLSLIMVLLTLFIFLTTFTEFDQQKVKLFREHYRKSLLLSKMSQEEQKKKENQKSPEAEALARLFNRMKGGEWNEKTLRDFLDRQELRDLEVVKGSEGLAIMLPEVITFTEGGVNLSQRAQLFLNRISALARGLPYLVEIDGYSRTDFPSHPMENLEMSARRALTVYRYLLGQQVSPWKLKLSGCEENPRSTNLRPNRVVIVFKDLDL